MTPVNESDDESLCRRAFTTPKNGVVNTRSETNAKRDNRTEPDFWRSGAST